MRRRLPAAPLLAALICMAAQAGFSAAAENDPQYQVLSPWAEINPLPQRGISPRLDNLAGKKIGLFANYKRAGRPIVEEVGRRLKQRFPDIQTSVYHSRAPNVVESKTDNKAAFEAWVKGVDAVVAAVGD